MGVVGNRRTRSVTVAALAGAVVTWVAVPIVSLARGGSLDDRTRRACRADGAVPLGPGLADVVSIRSARSARPENAPAVPAPRRAPDDVCAPAPR